MPAHEFHLPERVRRPVPSRYHGRPRPTHVQTDVCARVFIRGTGCADEEIARLGSMRHDSNSVNGSSDDKSNVRVVCQHGSTTNNLTASPASNHVTVPSHSYIFISISSRSCSKLSDKGYDATGLSCAGCVNEEDPKPDAVRVYTTESCFF